MLQHLLQTVSPPQESHIPWGYAFMLQHLVQTVHMNMNMNNIGITQWEQDADFTVRVWQKTQKNQPKTSINYVTVLIQVATE